MECEYLAKKFDRFGWERDRETGAQDRIKLDFMDALQDFPLEEVQAACRAAVMANPNKMPNEGHVKAFILKARSRRVQAHQIEARQSEDRRPPTEAEKARVNSVVREFTAGRNGEGLMAQILTDTAKRHGVSADDLISYKRTSEICAIRDEAMWTCRQEGYSLPQIGRKFSRDHTSVMMAVRRHEERLDAQAAPEEATHD